MKTVLIANRGEIAVRIIRTCKKLGFETIAVYSENDEASMHARLADVAVCIGPRQAEKSYLNIESILAAAKAYGADLIHPGVGFLSESAEFNDACEQDGITFIGPDAESMRLLGDKQAARKTMIDNGFPVVPGSEGPVSSEKDAAAIAKEIGYPLIIKAAFGGGGKGIRIVRDQKELEKEFPMVRREAEQAFGDGSLYIESYLENTRHIEVQILADQFGNTLHFGTRECSLQRKNQKMVEEAPAANVPAKVLKEMQQTAVDIAKCVGYKNAGTVEFLLTQDGKFYFMEMNTRIQVEHPVTESIYGIDLIKAQIQVALGHKLAIEQKNIEHKGHSIECRINAEDIEKNFMPSPGRIAKMNCPGGYGVRVDTGYADGDEISPFYDSMVMKLICTADDRDEATKLCLSALGELWVDGIKHNAQFAAAMLEDKDFKTGKIHTKWIENEFLAKFMRGR